MKPKVFLTGLVAVLALALAGVACGGDDEGDEQASIRTQKGLAVAAVSGQLIAGGKWRQACEPAGDSASSLGQHQVLIWGSRAGLFAVSAGRAAGITVRAAGWRPG
jgi:hypothetical protein